MTITNYDLLIDATDEDCPIPTIQAKNALDSMTAGQVLKLLANIEGVIRNIRTLVASNPYEILSESKVNETYVFFIKKL